MLFYLITCFRKSHFNNAQLLLHIGDIRRILFAKIYNPLSLSSTVSQKRNLDAMGKLEHNNPDRKTRAKASLHLDSNIGNTFINVTAIVVSKRT